MDKKKSVLDVTVVKLVCRLEESVCLYIDKSMPKKFRPTLVQQLVNGLGQARKYTIKAMDLSPRFAVQKLYYMEEAMSEVHNADLYGADEVVQYISLSPDSLEEHCGFGVGQSVGNRHSELVKGKRKAGSLYAGVLQAPE